MDTYDAIARRTTTKSFKPDALPRWAIERILGAAVRAPNHKLTEPWRFAVLTGSARERYAAIRRDHRAAKFDDPAAPEAQRSIDRTWREHLNTPAFIIVLQVLSDDPVRREEDYASIMMAIENLLVAAAADNIGSALRTGGIMDHADVRALVNAADNERIVGIVSAGYLAAEPVPTPRKKPVAELVRWLD